MKDTFFHFRAPFSISCLLVFLFWHITISFSFSVWFSIFCFWETVFRNRTIFDFFYFSIYFTFGGQTGFLLPFPLPVFSKLFLRNRAHFFSFIFDFLWFCHVSVSFCFPVSFFNFLHFRNCFLFSVSAIFDKTVWNRILFFFSFFFYFGKKN